MTAHIVEGTAEEPASAGSFLHIRSEAPLRTLNSSVWGSGFGIHRHLVNRQVSLNYHCADPAAEMEAYLIRQGIPPEEACGLLTAARIREAGYAEAAHSWEEDTERHSLEVCAWASAGLGNVCRSGDTAVMERLYPGTVNIIVAADARLTDAAMISAVITATEAKAAVLQDLGVVVPGSGRTATGTTTDAVLVAATGRGGREYAYAGGATVLGHLIGRTVYKAAYDACRRYLVRHPEYARTTPT